MDALTPAHVQSCYTALSQCLAPRSVQQVHMTLHKALTDALALGLIGRNVTEGVRLPRVVYSEQSWYTIEQLDHVFQATAGDRFHALWVVLGTCGLRLGEALALRWTDIDLERRTLMVRQSLTRDRQGGGMVFQDTKSAQSRRPVDLPDQTVAALKAHQERQAFERSSARWRDHNLVFPSQVGTPVEQGRVHLHWTKAVEKAGVPHHHIHDLRHSVATHLTMAGMSPKEVAVVLGHSNANMVLSVYGHVAPNTQRRAADLMEEMLRKRGRAG